MYFGPVGFLLFTLRRLGPFAGMLFIAVLSGVVDRYSVHFAVTGKESEQGEGEVSIR